MTLSDTTCQVIILAGGSRTRLYLATLAVSKQLLPIYDRSMIYYTRTTLMLGNISDILIIPTPEDTASFRQPLGGGSQWGLHSKYTVQPKSEGLLQAFIPGKKWLAGHPSSLVLGDNIFYGNNLSNLMTVAGSRCQDTRVLAYQMSNPQRYAIVDFDKTGRALNIGEKPAQPKSNSAVTGLYFCDECVAEIARGIRPSPRGKLEITDLNNVYLEESSLDVQPMRRGFAWLDTGTHESMLAACSSRPLSTARAVRWLQPRKSGGTVAGSSLKCQSSRAASSPRANTERDLVCAVRPPHDLVDRLPLERLHAGREAQVGLQRRVGHDDAYAQWHDLRLSGWQVWRDVALHGGRPVRYQRPQREKIALKFLWQRPLSRRRGMKILVTSSSGHLGTELRVLIPGSITPTSAEMNLTNVAVALDVVGCGSQI